MVEDLTNGRIRSSRSCHLDPDLAIGAFGQVGIAQHHLRRQLVGPGDLFLFFGLFREAEKVGGRYRYVRGAPRQHRLFGWLQIEEMATLGEDGTSAIRRWPHFARHPHLRAGWDSTNTLYVAAPHSSLAGRTLPMPGFGLFGSSPSCLCLSVDPKRPSIWGVPSWLGLHDGGVRLSYHGAPKCWDTGRLHTVAKGQEFVADIGKRADAQEWLKALFAGATFHKA